MKRYSPYLICLLLAGALGGTAYLSTDHLYLSLGVGGIAFLAFGFLLYPSLRTYAQKERVRHECYQFVNSFLITLSVCSSLDRAYEVAKDGIEGEFALLQPKLKRMNSLEKIEYLQGYFQMEIYALFVSVLHLYLDRGGDVLRLSSELMNELARIEENGRFLQGKSKRSAFQFLLMWTMSLAVMSFIRFGLSSFFAGVKTSPTYLTGVVLFYGFLLFSFFIYVRVYVGPTKWKGDRHGKTA